MDEIVGVEIKQEQICPEQVWLEILPEIIKTDLDGIVKTEDQYCMNYDENCSNNLPNENELFLKEENASLEVAEENSINKIDIEQHKVPTHVILKYKEEYEESIFKQWVKEEQGIERGENGLDEKILVHQKLDLPKIFPKAVTHLNTEIDLDDIVVKSEDQFCINCDENSSDNLPSEKRLVSKDCPSVEAIRSSEVLESENDSDVVKNLVNKTNYDQQDVSRQAEKKKKCNRNKSSLSKKKKHKCHYCDYETQYTSYLREHVSAIHEKGNAKVYCCQQCTFRTLHRSNLCKHMKLHEEKPPYQCPGCEKGFSEKWHLDNHLLKYHDNLHDLITTKIYYCEFCTYKTIVSNGLKRHVAHNHNRDVAEKFQCHKCDYFALQKGNLTKHLLVHSHSRPYHCTLCQKAFNQKSSLNYHILSKHEENADLLNSITNKIHRCTFCTYKTINNQHLYRHMKKHKQTST